MLLAYLLLSPNNLANKCWVSPVAAATVIPAVRVVSAIIGLKGPVAGRTVLCEMFALKANASIRYLLAREWERSRVLTG